MNNDSADFRHPMTEEVMAQAVWLKPEQPAEIEFAGADATWSAQARIIQAFAAKIG